MGTFENSLSPRSSLYPYMSRVQASPKMNKIVKIFKKSPKYKYPIVISRTAFRPRMKFPQNYIHRRQICLIIAMVSLFIHWF